MARSVEEAGERAVKEQRRLGGLRWQGTGKEESQRGRGVVNK